MSRTVGRRRAVPAKTGFDVARRRLANLLLTHNEKTPTDVVGRLVAVQAQDFAGARWAIGQRLAAGATDASIDAAFDDGHLLRTHVLRPTWHAVLPADLGWMQSLTAGRVKAKMTSRDRELGLDGVTYARSQTILARALEGGKHLTRDELRRALADAGIATPDQRLGHILMHAELDQVVCSGRRRGKQTTHALLDERVPPSTARKLERTAAVVELARRYFESHGPAQLADFAWWSGLALADARAAVAELGALLVADTVDGKTLYSAARSAPGRARRRGSGPIVHLLPNFDELTVAYRDRSFTYDKASLIGVGARPDVLSNHLVAVDGEVIGGWRRTGDKRGLLVAMRLLARPRPDVRAALEASAERLGRFLAMPARLEVTVV